MRVALAMSRELFRLSPGVGGDAGRGQRGTSRAPAAWAGRLGRGFPSSSPSPIGDAEVRRGWVTSPVPGAQHAAEPGVRSVPGPLASRAGWRAGQGQPRSGARDASMETLVLAKAPGKLQGVKRHPGPGHDAGPVPAIAQTLSLSRRTRRWAPACTPLPGPPVPPHILRWENADAPKHGRAPCIRPPGHRAVGAEKDPVTCCPAVPGRHGWLSREGPSVFSAMPPWEDNT